MDSKQTSSETAQVAALGPDQEMTAATTELKLSGIPGLSPELRIQARVSSNLGELNLVKVVVAEALRRSRLEPGFLKEVRQTFAEPGKTFGFAYGALLSDQRLVVLRSRPDSGTRTAAIAMIDRLAKSKLVRPHYLRAGGPSGLPTAALASERYQAYLMDLSMHGEESDLSSEFGLELKAASETLVKADSYLIVITSSGQWSRIGAYAPAGLVHDLQAPAPELVAERWLADRVPDHDFAAWFADPQIARLLDAATPREAVEIAQLIRTAVSPEFEPSLVAADLTLEQAAGGADFQLRVGSVVATRAQWRSQLLDWHKASGRTAFERNFLLAAAVLRGFPVGAAYKEAKRLCSVFDDKVESVSGHTGPGVIELLNTICADTAQGGSVSFSRPRWAEAVLDYYWQDRPDDHDAFIAWLVRLPRSDVFPSEARAAVAERVSEVMFDLIMTPERVGELGRVIDLWSAQKESTTAAWGFLGAASLHPRLGRSVAEMMLRWSKARGVQRRVAVAVVCGGEFGRLSTDKALVRLSYLIDSQESEVVVEAEQAVVALWEQPTIGRELLEQLIEWESGGVATHIRAARNIFTTVAGLPSPTDSDRPDLLVRAMADEEDLDLVAKAWRCLLESEMKSEPLLRALSPWFEAVKKHPGVASDLMSVFERATAGGRRSQARLQKCLYLWHGSMGALDEGPAGRFVREIERLGQTELNDAALVGSVEEGSFE